MKTATKRQHRCAICGRRRNSDQVIRSRFTGHYYCCVNGRVCRKNGRLI